MSCFTHGLGLFNSLVWEKAARVGPVIVLPAKQTSGPVPVEELPPGLNKISRPSLSGSQWRSGLNDTIGELIFPFLGGWVG